MPDQTSQMQKAGGSGPPGEDYPPVTETGDGFAHKNATKGVPKENTANKQQFPGAKGELPGGVAGPGGFSSGGEGALNRLPRATPMTKAQEAIGQMSATERASLIKMLLAGDAPTPEVQKTDEVVTRSDLAKFREELTGEFRKALAEIGSGSSLQKQGIVPAPTEAPKPGLSKMEQQPTYDAAMQQAQAGSELQKGPVGEGPWTNDGQTLVAGPVPSMTDLAKIPLSRGW